MSTLESTKQSVFIVNDLCCATEEASIRKKLSALPGVTDLQFNLITHKLTVHHATDDQHILSALKSIGLPGRPEPGPVGSKRHAGYQRILYSVISSSVFLILGQSAAALNASSTLTTSLLLMSILSGGWQVALRSLKTIKNVSLDMNFLMTIAVIGAVAIGEYAEGAAVMLLFAFSLLLESLSMQRTRNAIQSLMKLSPPTAIVKRGGSKSVVPVGSVEVGEVIVLKPGERIPVDGEVVNGVSSVDQSPLTGESLPVLKQSGDVVFAGSLNQRGSLEIRALKPFADSTLARIVHLVEEAEGQRAPSQTFVEKFATYYTPAVFILAIGVATLPPLLFEAQFMEWLYRSLVLLVIACPCALVISTPVSIVSALTNAARNGLLIKGGKYLERMAAISAMAFDKTGTLTEGHLGVVDIHLCNSMSKQELIKIAASVELKSEHHLAEALLRYAQKENIDLNDVVVEHFEAIPGKGVRATVNRRSFAMGNHYFAEELGVCSIQVERILTDLESKGQTAVIVADEKEVLGVIAVADTIRIESKAALARLHMLGVQETILLTGDNRGTAEQIASQMGFNNFRAELMPEDKVRLVKELKSRFSTVSMVGDGFNDAPALAMSDVGIAMGRIGSDTTLESADVVLMSDDLTKVPYGISLARKTLRIIKQNIALAIVVKAIFIVLGVFGMSSLWLAILADDGATMIVVMNGLRLLKNMSS